MSTLLYISPTGKANNYNVRDTRVTIYLLGIETRARLIRLQLSCISHLRPQKFRKHVIDHSHWMSLLRRAIRKHHRSVNKLRFLFAEESELSRRPESVHVIRTTRQDGDILVPIWILDTNPRSPFSDRTEPYLSSTDHGIDWNNGSGSGRACLDGKQGA